MYFLSFGSVRNGLTKGLSEITRFFIAQAPWQVPQLSFNVTKETPPHQALREPWELLIFNFLGYFFSLQVDSMLAIFESLQWLFMLT